MKEDVKDRDYKKISFLEENDRRALGYRQNEGSKDLVFLYYDPKEPTPPDTENRELFDIIFAVNPLTKLPDGDIAVFMNQNTSPEVRQFIQQNLQTEVPDNLLAPTVSDSDLEKFGGADGFENFRRRNGESIENYRDRVIDFVKELNKPKDD